MLRRYNMRKKLENFKKKTKKYQQKILTRFNKKVQRNKTPSCLLLNNSKIKNSKKKNFRWMTYYLQEMTSRMKA